MRDVAGKIDLVTAVQIVGVDERDSNWEDRQPRFRVYLHRSGETSTRGWTDSYDITGADVVQVIDWAQRQAGESLTYSVALVHDDDDQERGNPGRGRGLVWLIGMDGNDSAVNGSEAEVQRRMLSRRATPVGVPGPDRMPSGVPDPYNDGTETR
jgi:hypothetical protein